MRSHRLLNAEHGSAAIETVFAIVLLVVLTLGAVQVAFALYARNVVASAAHEGVRAAVERGATGADAVDVVAAVVERAAGGLVDDLRVDVTSATRGPRTVLTVHVRGATAVFGPVPVALPLSAEATSVTETP